MRMPQIDASPASDSDEIKGILMKIENIVACQAHPALVKIGPVFVRFVFLVAR